jgi:hypothetical protein
MTVKQRRIKIIKEKKNLQFLVIITPNKLTNPLTIQSIMDSTIVGIEGLNFKPSSPKNSVKKFSLLSHKHGKNNNEIGCLYLLCHDLGLKIFKAIKTIKSETKDIISKNIYYL